MATKLLNLGLDIADVQRFLGHEDISTTQIYAVTSVAALRRKFDLVTDPLGLELLHEKPVNADLAQRFPSKAKPC